MVVSFFIQTLSNDSTFVPEVCFWEPIGFSCDIKTQDVGETSQKEKNGLSYISKRIQAEFLFRNQVAASHNNPKAVTGSESGVFRIKDNNYFSQSFTVVWHAALGCAFVLVLKPEENKGLADTNLNTIVKYVATVLDLPELDPKQQIINNPDKVACILNVFLPSGQLLALNHRALKVLQKELEKLLSDKM